mmetsp:Transcript_42734/g.65628  ORF Transcript_42734/g.65628 Transcript_42734/m.65628 type:complete len:270 (-) Transcript_42734:1378-2187(-)
MDALPRMRKLLLLGSGEARFVFVGGLLHLESNRLDSVFLGVAVVAADPFGELVGMLASVIVWVAWVQIRIIELLEVLLRNKCTGLLRLTLLRLIDGILKVHASLLDLLRVLRRLVSKLAFFELGVRILLELKGLCLDEEGAIYVFYCVIKILPERFKPRQRVVVLLVLALSATVLALVVRTRALRGLIVVIPAAVEGLVVVGLALEVVRTLRARFLQNQAIRVWLLHLLQGLGLLLLLLSKPQIELELRAGWFITSLLESLELLRVAEQ